MYAAWGIIQITMMIFMMGIRLFFFGLKVAAKLSVFIIKLIIWIIKALIYVFSRGKYGSISIKAFEEDNKNT